MSERPEGRLAPLERGVAPLLRLTALDSALARVLARPRLLQGCAVAVCGLMLALSLVGGAEGSTKAPESPPPWTPAAADTTGITFAQAKSGDLERQAVAAVEGYNQASIEAARRIEASLLAPHLDPLGPAWSAVQAEYARRLANAEQHDATLRRWGVLSADTTGDEATVVTQELWDDVVRRGGVLAGSRRGVLARNAYRLRHAGSSWLIVDVTTETLVR
jgi:hypothetical protein